MNKKTVLLIIGLLIIAMGVLALLPGMSMGSEPMWHAIAKLVLGVAAVFIALKNEKAVGITTVIVGVVLVVMGLLGLFMKVSTFSAPTWHSAAVAVVGLIVLILGTRK